MRSTLRWRGLALVIPCLFLAACSSGGLHTSSSTTSTTSKAASTSTSTSTSTVSATTSSIASSTTTTTQAPPPSTGALSIKTTISVPGLAPGQILATESPDGAVFLTNFTQGGGTSPPQVVWVVDGNHAPAVAEHTAGGVESLAADAHDLYVGTYANVTAYSRTTGNQVGQWSLPPVSTANISDADLEGMLAGGGSLLVSLSSGNVVSAYRINPAVPTAPQLIAQGSSVAFGPAGSAFYVRSDHHLVRVGPRNVSFVGPLMANTPNSEGGGVQYVSRATGGYVFVSEPAGQGLDAGITSYLASTLAQTGSFAGTASQQIAATSIGILTLNGPGACPQPSGATVTNICVARLTPGGVISNPLPVGEPTVLLGPDPVLINTNTANTRVVAQRLG
jgi:hypothetical protein